MNQLLSRVYLKRTSPQQLKLEETADRKGHFATHAKMRDVC